MDSLKRDWARGGAASERAGWIRALKVTGLLPSCFTDDGTKTPTQLLSVIATRINEARLLCALYPRSRVAGLVLQRLKGQDIDLLSGFLRMSNSEGSEPS